MFQYFPASVQSRRSFKRNCFRKIPTLVVLVSVALAATFCDRSVEAKSPDRPNILFIMSDDHGYQAIGAYDSKVNKTPNIDRIANEGMRFDRCFVTNSICGPCRATILTGKYSHLNGFARNGDRFNGEQQTVAKLLQKTGYQTAVIGKWHLESDPTGFDYYHILKGQGPYYNPPMLTSDGPVNHTGYTTDIITDLALDWLKEKRDDTKPFYLMYQHKAPHRNWQPGPKQLNNYDSVMIPEPETLYDDYEGRTSAAKSQAMTIKDHLSPNDLKFTKPGNFTPEQLKAWNEAYEPKNAEFKKANLQGKELMQWKYQRYAKDYLRCVDSVDENVGRVLDYLKETGLDKNTIVIYTSDQGWYLGEHGWYDKRWMYEESFRTPLLVRWPGHIKPGTSSETMVMNLDFAETFLDIAGAPIPDDMQGRSMVPVLKGETPKDWRKSVYYHYYEFPGPHSVQKHYGVRTERHKLINFYERDEWELFDLEKDPNELKSVYDNPEYETVRKEMMAELQRLRDQYKDEGSVIKFSQHRNVKLSLAQDFATDEPQKLEGKPFAQLDSRQVDPSQKPLTVGGWIKPENEGGVIIAQGGESMGFSLYLKDSVPTFSIRNQGNLYSVAGEKIETGQWTHVAAILDEEAGGQIYIDGNPSGKKAELQFIDNRPADGLSVGMDASIQVVDYGDQSTLQGEVKDVRLYWGVLQEKKLNGWATGKQDPKESTPKTKSASDSKTGQIKMFNGKDLAGWNKIKESYFKEAGEVKVVDGEIEIGKGKPGSGIVIADDLKEKLPRINYRVEFEAKRTDGGDFFCGMTFPVGDDYLTLILGGWGGTAVGLSNLDNMAAIDNETTDFIEFENNKWYKVKHEVTEGKVETWLDDEKIISVKTEGKKLDIWWEMEPGRPFGIATWNTAARYRNIVMTDLSVEK